MNAVEARLLKRIAASRRKINKEISREGSRGKKASKRMAECHDQLGDVATSVKRKGRAAKAAAKKD